MESNSCTPWGRYLRFFPLPPLLFPELELELALGLFSAAIDFLRSSSRQFGKEKQQKHKPSVALGPSVVLFAKLSL